MGANQKEAGLKVLDAAFKVGGDGRPYGGAALRLNLVRRDLDGTLDITDPNGIIAARKKAAGDAKAEPPSVDDVIVPP